MKYILVVGVLVACSVWAQTPQEMIEPYFSGGEKSVTMKTHAEVYKKTAQENLTLRVYEPVSGRRKSIFLSGTSGYDQFSERNRFFLINALSF